MISGYLSQWNSSYPFQTPEEEMNRHIGSLKNEKIYNILRTSFDKSRSDELKNINPEYLLQSDAFGQTMLHWAAIKGDVDITKFIIEKTGFELFNMQTNIDKYTALHLAVHSGNNAVIDLLLDESKKNNLDSFVDIVDIHGQTALHWAAHDGNFYACQKLYSTMSVNAIAFQMEDRKQTALHFAVQGGHYNVTELLLSKINVVEELVGKVDKFGQSALHWAADKSSDLGKKLVDLLIEKTAALSSDLRKNFFLIRKNEGYTALHIAVHSANNGSIQSLVEATKDSIPEFISIVDEHGQTALHWAASDGNLIASTFLCKAMKHEDINIQTKDRKQTALHFAVQGGHTQVVQLLLENKADITLKDFNGCTALDWAKGIQTESKTDIINLLEGAQK